MFRRKDFALTVTVTLILLAQITLGQARREISFPDIPDYQTLVCDFHMHTVFSDGSVWPPVRVDEAWREGLDLIAISDHIEYQPHKDDLPTNHNRSHELAAGAARQKNILLPRSAEITRDTPPGHFNAIFVEDIAKLDTKDFFEVHKRANEQGAFVFWNHPAWQGVEKGRWNDDHTKLFENKWLHGIEICNGDGYHEDGHRWALEKNLTLLGNSDLHDPSLGLRDDQGNHRTLTLVFVKERTLKGVKEALFAGRTVVWWKDQLLGREPLLREIYNASVKVAKPHLVNKDTLWTTIANDSEVDIVLQRLSDLGPKELTLPAGAITLLKTKFNPKAQKIALPYRITNFIIAPNTGMPIDLTIPK